MSKFMTVWNFLVPFLGFKDVPKDVADALGFDPRTSYEGFTFSWFGFNVVFYLRDKEQ